MKKNKHLFYLTITAVFAAASFVGTIIHIPLPSGGLVHLGNFVMILAGLLCGGMIGGLSGSIGMGLYDVLAGYSPSTFIRSFILKFFIGFLVGFMFQLIVKRKIKIFPLLIILGGFFLILTILGIFMTTNLTEGYYLLNVFSETKKISQADIILATIFTFIFSLGLILAGICSPKLKKGQQAVLFTTTIGMLINIVLELILRTLLTHTIDGIPYSSALATAIAKIPASILTAFITVFIAVLVYKPIYLATRKLNPLFNIDIEL